jgi:hypothetical protein
LTLPGDSVYSALQFERLQAYLAGQASDGLTGVIYVSGEVLVPPGSQLRITDGALVAEDTIQVDPGATLEILHSVATRTLPGVLVVSGRLTILDQARLRVHGLVYASYSFEMEQGAYVDIVGSVLSNDMDLGVHNMGATMVIRHDPAVLGTPGLLVPDGGTVVAWVASWEELP